MLSTGASSRYSLKFLLELGRTPPPLGNYLAAKLVCDSLWPVSGVCGAQRGNAQCLLATPQEEYNDCHLPNSKVQVGLPTPQAVGVLIGFGALDGNSCPGLQTTTPDQVEVLVGPQFLCQAMQVPHPQHLPLYPFHHVAAHAMDYTTALQPHIPQLG